MSIINPGLFDKGKVLCTMILAHCGGGGGGRCLVENSTNLFFEPFTKQTNQNKFIFKWMDSLTKLFLKNNLHNSSCNSRFKNWPNSSFLQAC